MIIWHFDKNDSLRKQSTFTDATTGFPAKWRLCILGARGFSCAVSGFGQVLKSEPRKKPLDQSAIPLIAPNQLQPRLYLNIRNLTVLLRVIGTQVFWNNPSTHHACFVFVFWRRIETEDLDQAIAEVTGTFDGEEEIRVELREDTNYIQRIDRLWKITAVPVTTWHMQCVKRGSVGNTRLLPRAKMLLIPMNFFSSG